MTTEDPILNRRQLMAKCGWTSTETVRRALKEGRLPKPDIRLSKRTVGWKASTLRAAGINV